MVGNGIARDLEESGYEAFGTLQCAAASVDAEEDILENVFHIRLALHPLRDEVSQRLSRNSSAISFPLTRMAGELKKRSARACSSDSTSVLGG